MNAWVYIVRCSDGAYYVGSVRGDLAQRIAEHNAGRYAGYTSSRRPVILLFSQAFDRILDAIAMERKLKGWSRAKKEALIRGDYAQLSILSRSRSPPAAAGLAASPDAGQVEPRPSTGSG